MALGSGSGWRRAATRRGTLALMVLVSLVVAACGGQSHSAGAGSATATATTRTGPTATGVPYTFPVTWHAVPNAPAQVASIVFAPSAPQVGYACIYVPASGGNAPPGFASTNDGGQTWRAASALPFLPEPPFAGCTLFVAQLDAIDVFLEQYLPIPNSEGASAPTVWRSRDGGANWHQIATVKNASGRQVPWSNIAVVGSRLVASTGRLTPNDVPPPNDLYASDDEGATWQPIAQSIVAQQLNVGALTVVGTTLVVEAHPPCSCYASSRPAVPLVNLAGAARHARPAAPKSSFQTNSHWISIDGGTTWTQMKLPSGQVSEMSFTRAANGGAVYGVALIYGLDPSNLTLHSALYSADGGSTWRILPPFSGAGGGYPDPTTFGVRGSVAVAPNGTVVVGAWHDVNASIDAGIFALRPGDASPAWRPLAPGAATQNWQAVATATGTRLWALVPAADQSSFSLEYVDVP